MLVNIFDDRRDGAAWQEVRATVEPAAREGLAPHEQADTVFAWTPQRRTLSVAAAVQWAQRLPFGVDLYLADRDRDEPAPVSEHSASAPE